MREAVLLLNEPIDAYRVPGIQVLANGQPVAGVTAVKVRSNNYFSADCFDLKIALTTDATFWANEPAIDIDIQFRDKVLSRFVSVPQGRANFSAVRSDPADR